jgi:hypothetical protein
LRSSSAARTAAGIDGEYRMRSPWLASRSPHPRLANNLHDCSDRFRRERIAGWDLHPLESAACSRRTPKADISFVAGYLVVLKTFI